MTPRARELARAILAGCAKTEEIHELARAVLVAPDMPPYQDDLRAELDRLERASEAQGGTVAGSWRMGIREAVSALRPYLSGMHAEIERLRAEQPGALAGGDVARWAALADAATPEPWEYDPAVSEPEALRSIKALNADGWCVAVDLNDEDGAFIAAARTAVPALCAEVARLRAVRAPVVNRLKIPCAEPGCYEWSVGVDAAGRDVCRRHWS